MFELYKSYRSFVVCSTKSMTVRAKTSSFAIADRPCDASCLSVVSFNCTIRRAQSSITSASDLPLHANKCCYVPFS